MEDIKNKKILLSILGITVLLIGVIGISFAAFSFTTSSDVNSITAGTITMSYSESKSGINLTQAMPITDGAGKLLSGSGNEFKFNVSVKSSGNLTIPYKVVVTPDAGNTLAKR